MTRKKVTLEWIANDNARRLSLKKRRLGLLKKMSELSTLCGVNACAIIYSPDEIEPTVWPSHDVVQQQLAQFQSLSELKRLKKMMNQETYIKEQVKKAREQLMKCEKRNKEMEMAQLMYQINQGKGLDELNLNELNGLSLFVEEKIKEISKRIEFFQQAPFAPTSALPDPHLPLPPHCLTVKEMAQTGSGGDWGTPTEPLLWNQFDMGLPPTDFIPHGSGDPGLCHGSLVGGRNFGPFRSDTGLGLHPLGGHLGSNSIGSEIGLPHLWHSGGSSSGVGKDIE
ncbi:hypothetical protein POUND7_015592 [Theobroma cacao]